LYSTTINTTQTTKRTKNSTAINTTQTKRMEEQHNHKEIN
jgi:hypothetical protein